jgi:hypothetical protein
LSEGIERNPSLNAIFQNREDVVNQESMVDKVLDRANREQVDDRTMAMTGHMGEMTIMDPTVEMIWVDMIVAMIEVS